MAKFLQFFNDKPVYDTFKKEIIKLSYSDDYNDAKKEWVIKGFVSKGCNKCICGKDIIHHFGIYNVKTKKDYITGAICGINFCKELGKDTFEYAKTYESIIKRSENSFFIHDPCKRCSKSIFKTEFMKNDEYNINARYDICYTCFKNPIKQLKNKCQCGTTPSFNYKGEKTRKYCSKCKKKDMVNLSKK